MVILFSVLSLQAAVFVGIAPTLLYQIVPVSRRMTTISLGYNIGQALSGGCLALGLAALTEATGLLAIPGHALSVVYFCMLYAVKPLTKFLKANKKEIAI